MEIASPAGEPLDLLFASAELAPFAQTGGLGDAVAGLARALGARGHRVTCAFPGYRSALAHPDLPDLREAGAVRISLPSREIAGRWLAGDAGGLALRLLDVPELYGGAELYGGPDEGLRFIAFARAVASLTADTAPAVLVAHDWHAALAICTLRTLRGFRRAESIATVQTVHNGAHQGRYPAATMAMTGLPEDLFRPEGLEFHGDLSLLKGGLGWADRIVAVSPSYARELQTPEFGAGLEGLYRYRAKRLVGITNGIDTSSHDPATDAALAEGFDAKRLAGRARCRRALLEELGLEDPEAGWLLGAVGRLAVQKGWDVIADALPDLVAAGASVALLGDGDATIAKRLEDAAKKNPGRVALRLGWDAALASRLYAGADSVLVPSRFEPCGLVQLLAQRYGALPVAHRVGGLRDTIRDGETGILFEPLSAEALVAGVRRAAELHRERGANALVERLLGCDVSWRAPAERWERLLREVAAEPAARA